MLGGTVVAWPRCAFAEAVRTVGVLMPASGSDPQSARLLNALRQSLAELGWREGTTLHLELRWANNEDARAMAYAQELVSLKPDVIVAPATSLKPVREATRSIPIVFLLIVDPVGQGIVSSLAHPGGNVTGFAAMEFSMGGKFVELLKEIAPDATRVLVLLDQDNGATPQWWRSIEGPARKLGFEPQQALVRAEQELDAAVQSFAQARSGNMIVPPQTLFVSHRARLIALAARERLPAVYGATLFASEGGLLSYGIDVAHQFMRAASYVDRILKGTNPSDLPVEQPTKFELVVNLKTAKDLGLTIPGSLLAQADEVIE
jgi:putative ABC transport system substrate-binding protein